MVDAATEFKKSGFSDEDSATLAGVSAMFQNVADDALSAGDSAGFIIAQLKAFNLEASDATHVIDAVNNVSNNFAVSSSDLSTNLGKASAALASGNTSFEETLGLMTAITEITRNGSRSARGLVSIQSRLNQVVDESSSTGKQLVELYKEQNIALFDQNGQLRDSYDILKDLAAVWPNLTRNQQAEFALAQAGANQTQNFTALMNNFQVAIDATATAMDSAGSAMKENSSYMESLEAQTTQLKATFQDFANNVIDKELVSSILTLANDALGALNNEGGRTITQWTLLTGVLTGGLTIYGQIASKLIGAAKSGLTFASAITGAGTAASGAAVGFGTLAATALPIAAILAGVAIAGWEVYKWIKDTHKPLQEYTDEIQANTQQLEKNRDRLAEIEQMSWDKKTSEILDEYDALVKENEELQRNIDLLEKRRRKQAVRQARRGGEVETGGTYYTAVGIDDFTQYKSAEKAYLSIASGIGLVVESAEDAKQQLEAMGITLQEHAEMVEVDSLEYDQHLIKSLAEYQQKIKDGQELTIEEVRNYQNLKAEVAERVEGLKELTAQGETLDYTENELIKAYDELIAAEEIANSDTTKLANSLGLTTDQAKILIAKYPELTNGIKGCTAATIDAIAKNEILANQDLNLDSKIKALNELIAALGNTAIAARFAAESLQIEEWIKQGKENGSIAAVDALLDKYGTVDADKIYAGLWDKYYEQFQSGIKTVPDDRPPGTTPTKKATDLALEEFKGLQKDLEHQRELGLISEEEYYTKLEQFIKDYKAKATAHMKEYGTDVDTINRNMYQYEEAIYKGRAKLAADLAEKQKKAAEEAAKAQQEALEKQKEDFESAVNYVVKHIDKEITKLQDLRDQTEKYYDDKIDALNETNDALEDQIEYEELLDNLARAKQKKLYVFQNGQFQYIQDTEAISKAQAELDAYEREKALKQEVKNLETLKDQALASIDKQIEGWEKYKEEWSDVVDSYQDEQDKLLAEQILGVNLEKENWNKRITNLSSFVSEYNSILSRLNSINSSGNGSDRDEVIKTNSSFGANRDFMAEAIAAADAGNRDKAYALLEQRDKKLDAQGRNSASGINKEESRDIINSRLDKYTTKKHANGTIFAPGGLSLVGEKGPELRVLNSGDGIIPADATRNLWDWAAYSPKDFMGNMGSDNIFHIGNIALPNVTDAKSFVNGLKQLAYQRAYKRA